MKRKFLCGTLAALCMAQSGHSGEIRLNVDPAKAINKVDVNVYGHFLEHIYHSANGGLWGDLMWDRSFEGMGVPSWRIENEGVYQDATKCDARLGFGEPTWADFEFLVEARITSGRNGVYIYLHDQGPKEQARANEGKELKPRDAFRINLSASARQEISLERSSSSGKRLKFETVSVGKGGLKEGSWQGIRVRSEGPRIQVWLDGAPVIDYKDDGNGSRTGRIGVGTSDTQAGFRNFKVSSLDGKVLLGGVPPRDESVPMPSWRPFGEGRVGFSEENPLNGQRCEIIETHGPEAGVLQAPMAIRANETYKGSLWLRGTVLTGVSVRLQDGAKVIAETTISGTVGPEWKEYAFELNPKDAAENASLVVATAGISKIALDQVSMMPESWRKEGGFRPDLLKAVADLQPSIIRWPGGLFAERYRWKAGIGPQSKRQCYPLQLWDDIDVNNLGTDEFIALCRKVKAEPVMVINAGRYDLKTPRSVYIQEGCVWIEYCNGSATSTWGRIRAQNGHPEPYGIKYWEIDNEVWLVGLAEYVKIVNDFAAAMKKVDPSITLLICGGGGLDNKWTDTKKDAVSWNPRLINASADKGSYLSIHKYTDPRMFAEGPLTFEAHFKELGELLAKSSNPKMKVFVSEWNAQSTDWRSGLYAGGLLNAMERQGDVVTMACPALFLRHVSAKDWNNAFINFDHRTWYAGANYVVMKLWREYYAPVRIGIEGDAGALNVVATKSEDGSLIVFKAVNPSKDAASVTLNIPATLKIKSAAMQRIAPGSLTARNSFEKPNEIQPEPSEVKVDGPKVSFDLPPTSAGALKIILR